MSENAFKTQTQKLALLALFIAFRVCAGFFSINLTSTLVISFSFLFIIIEVLIFDFKYCMISAAIGDILNFIVFPNGSFFIGYTLFAMLQTGLYWFMLHGKKLTLKRLFFTKLLNNMFCNVVINSCLISYLYQVNIQAAMLTRLYKNIILLPIEVALLYLLIKLLGPTLVNKGFISSSQLPQSNKQK